MLAKFIETAAMLGGAFLLLAIVVGVVWLTAVVKVKR